jgi:pimeloyl-ACP methyl ester carboxylesterase
MAVAARKPRQCFQGFCNKRTLSRTVIRLSRQRVIFLLMVVGLAPCFHGCAWNLETARRLATVANFGAATGVEVRKRPRNPLERTMSTWSAWTGYGGLQPTERTRLFLRQYALEEDYRQHPAEFLGELRNSCQAVPDLQRLQVLAELAYIEGNRERLAGNEKLAGEFLATAVMASYQYLFDPRLDVSRNAYDPLFRQVCDTYNAALEGMLRIMKSQDTLRPGGIFAATSLDGQTLQVAISIKGRWREHEFERFEFVSDFDTTGLQNVYHTYGLGVPLIGIRSSSTATEGNEQEYYPIGLSVPLTAFIQTSCQTTDDEQSCSHKCLIQLIDPLEQTDIEIGERKAPLESDISTPVAYYLSDPLLGTSAFATAAMLDADFASKFRGMYMLEPFDPARIPVVLVHGFWSSPTTWTEMFNDLRADKAIRDNYQFWFYMYPSGQPFWFSARQMRNDMQELREHLDPQHSYPALDQIVLVGHSMGGLVSRLQTLDSENRFWNLISDRPIEELKCDEAARNCLRETLYFTANPAITRVITIGTPHRGSNVANSTTRWLGHQLFRLPANLTNQYAEVVRENKDYFRDSHLLEISTSIDSLSPDSHFFDAMQAARRSPRVTYNNIIGIKPRSSWSIGKPSPPSDGVVLAESARTADASSEIEVPAEHSVIHQHPLAILEIRRILIEHLKGIQQKKEDVASAMTPLR